MADSGSRSGLINNDDANGSVLGRLKQVFTFRDLVQPCVAEFVGVLLLVFIGSMSATSGNIVAVAFAHGLTITLLVACFGHISGAHVNPAVTLAVTLGGGVSPLVAIFYFLAQIFGAIAGAGCCMGVLSYYESNSTNQQTVFEQIQGGTLAPGMGVGPGEAIFCEVMLTAILTITVLMTAVDTKGSTVIAPLAIGFALLVSILAGGPVSGAALNPARAFGPAVVMTSLNTAVWRYHYVYWVGPVAGALISVVVYRVFFASNDKRVIYKED